MSAPLPYPVIWADAKTAAGLFSMAESTFRDHVAAGRLPEGILLGGKRLWRVADIDSALAKLLSSPKDTDEILTRIQGIRNGQTTKARSNAA